MRTFPIDDKKYRLPECWHDVTYSQYVALLSTDNSLTFQISLFTGLSKTILHRADMNVEMIASTLFFLNTAPVFKPKPTATVGPYRVRDVVIKTFGQFEDLQQLLKKAPSPMLTIEDNQKLADIYLEACAIYTTKIKYGSYEQSKLMQVKEEIKAYSSIEVLQTGGFFLFSVLKAQQPQQIN